MLSLYEVAGSVALLVCVPYSSLINIFVVNMPDSNIDVKVDEWVKAERNEYYDLGSQVYNLSSGREWSARYGGYDKSFTLLPVFCLLLVCFLHVVVSNPICICLYMFLLV